MSSSPSSSPLRSTRPSASSRGSSNAVRVTICDVGPRDGLQNEPETLEPVARAELVNRLAAARLPRVEAASFVRADSVPQMADAETVVAGIERREGTEYSGLALNEKGFERLPPPPPPPRDLPPPPPGGVLPRPTNQTPPGAG